jgi:predicted nucleic acid-binding protein
MYLLDTVVLSELRRKERRRSVVFWIQSVSPADLFLSAVTVGEIELGIERQRTVNPPFAEDLAIWLETIIRAYGEHILPLDVNVARRWGRLGALLGNKGLDLAIAATALEYGLIVVTRNVSDFEPTGVAVLDPFVPKRGRKS